MRIMWQINLRSGLVCGLFPEEDIIYFVEGVRPPYGPRERGHKGGPKFGVDLRAEPSPRGRAGSGRLLISDGNQRASYHRLSLASSQARFFSFLFQVVLSQLLRKGNGRGADFAQRTASLPVIPPIYTP